MKVNNQNNNCKSNVSISYKPERLCKLKMVIAESKKIKCALGRGSDSESEKKSEKQCTMILADQSASSSEKW